MLDTKTKSSNLRKKPRDQTEFEISKEKTTIQRNSTPTQKLADMNK